jgi:hypothetical protein
MTGRVTRIRDRALAQQTTTTQSKDNMKTPIVAVLLGAVLMMLAGCASTHRGPAYGREQEFRRQLADSIPVKEYGYTIKDLRFSPDYKKALVVFTHPGKQEGLENSHQRPDWEFELKMDEFGRYRGMTMQPFYSPGTANTPGVNVIVAFPSK